MIISGGEKHLPVGSGERGRRIREVKDVAVIGIPHEKWGETVLAVVVLHEGQTANPEDITNYCRGKIAGYKVPKNVVSSPMTRCRGQATARSSTGY